MSEDEKSLWNAREGLPMGAHSRQLTVGELRAILNELPTDWDEAIVGLDNDIVSSFYYDVHSVWTKEDSESDSPRVLRISSC